MNRFEKKDFFTIPNYLTYFRLLCVPAFLVLFFLDINYNIYFALGVFIIAELTDILDGKIARKYNLITDIGKILDPLADKLLQVAAIISLSIHGYVPWTFTIILTVKELYMIIGASALVNKNVIVKSNKWGKRAAMWLGYGMIMAFFHPYFSVDRYLEGHNIQTYVYIDWVVLGIGIIVALVAVINYTIAIYIALKDKKLDGNEKIHIEYKEEINKNNK